MISDKDTRSKDTISANYVVAGAVTAGDAIGVAITVGMIALGKGKPNS